MTEKVKAEIEAQQARNAAQWGGATHDDAHAPFDWFDFIGTQCEKLGNGAMTRGEKYADTPDFRARFVAIAALCADALESFDRKAVKP